MFKSDDNQQPAMQPAQDQPADAPVDNTTTVEPAAEPQSAPDVQDDTASQDNQTSDTVSKPNTNEDVLPKKDDDFELPTIKSTTSSPSGFTPSTDVPEHGSENLDELKKQALGALSPLVDKLDQSPEEKFNTTMMLIQANDNKDLLPKAYEAAQAIPDEKVKAQALLDVVNEINYFSQPKD